MKVYVVTTTEERCSEEYRTFDVNKVFYTKAAADEYRDKRWQKVSKHIDHRFNYEVEVLEAELED
jgi:hypothetical protein